MYQPPESRYLEFGEGPVHVADYGGVGRPVVCVHGLGGSHLNWASSVSAMRDIGHVTAIDLVGSGLTPVAGRSGAVEANRRLLDGYLRTLDEPALLVANSMGATIAISQAGRVPESVSAMVLVSPALPPTLTGWPDIAVALGFAAYALPGAGELLLALRRRLISPETSLLWVMRLCSYRPDLLAADVLEAHLELARRRVHIAGVDRAFLQSARSLLGILAWRRSLDGRIRSVQAPTLVIGGMNDRLVHHQSIRRLMPIRPDWAVQILDNVGHIAMLEVPDAFGEIVDGWLEGNGA